jgi:hypothetical protein
LLKGRLRETERNRTLLIPGGMLAIIEKKEKKLKGAGGMQAGTKRK